MALRGNLSDCQLFGLGSTVIPFTLNYSWRGASRRASPEPCCHRMCSRLIVTTIRLLMMVG